MPPAGQFGKNGGRVVRNQSPCRERKFQTVCLVVIVHPLSCREAPLLSTDCTTRGPASEYETEFQESAFQSMVEDEVGLRFLYFYVAVSALRVTRASAVKRHGVASTGLNVPSLDVIEKHAACLTIQESELLLA
jgi:hypothetical protein